MINWLEAITVAGLAAHSVNYLLQKSTILEGRREAIKKRTEWWAKLLKCALCTSYYTASAAVILVYATASHEIVWLRLILWALAAVGLTHIYWSITTAMDYLKTVFEVDADINAYGYSEEEPTVKVVSTESEGVQADRSDACTDDRKLL